MTFTAYQPQLAATDWRVYRIVPSIFPPVSLFDRISHPADLEALFAVEALTNDRLREEVGDISLVPVEDRVTGPGSTPFMASFTHLSPQGGRFNTPDFGAYYASPEIETAIAETRYHREEFLSFTNEGPVDVDMRVYLARVMGDLHDARTDAPLEIYDPDNHSHGQALATVLRHSGSNGLIYASVRAPGGNCGAVFRPRLLSECRQERHLTYRWDGHRVTQIYEKRDFSPNGRAPET